MQSFYPKGALKGREKFEALLAQRHEKPTVIYLISVGYHNPRQADVYKFALSGSTLVDKSISSVWSLYNKKEGSSLSFGENEQTGYIESAFSQGYVFENLWHAYAHILHLKQSNLHIDGKFPIAVN